MDRINRPIGDKIAVKIFMFLMLVSSTVYAVPSLPPGMPNGACWADPMNDLEISLGASSFSSNQQGATATVSFMTQPDIYAGWCYSLVGSLVADHYSAATGVTTLGASAGYYKLSEDVDFKIAINLWGIDVTVPFWDSVHTSNAGPGGIGVSALQNASIGNNGRVYFKLRRALIGGAFFIPSGIELGRLYRYVYTGQYPTIPIYRLITRLTIVPIPVECRINQGKTIDIDFGLIESRRLTTSALSSLYQEQRSLQYKCNTTLNQDIQVILVADSTSFSDAIKTSNPDIGIVMLYKDQVVKPVNGFKTHLTRVWVATMSNLT